MSRCNEWHNAHDGVINYLLKNGLATDIDVLIKSKNHIYAFTSKGSFSERCLEVGERFKEFKHFLKQS